MQAILAQIGIIPAQNRCHAPPEWCHVAPHGACVPGALAAPSEPSASVTTCQPCRRARHRWSRREGHRWNTRALLGASVFHRCPSGLRGPRAAGCGLRASGRRREPAADGATLVPGRHSPHGTDSAARDQSGTITTRARRPGRLGPLCLPAREFRSSQPAGADGGPGAVAPGPDPLGARRRSGPTVADAVGNPVTEAMSHWVRRRPSSARQPCGSPPLSARVSPLPDYQSRRCRRASPGIGENCTAGRRDPRLGDPEARLTCAFVSVNDHGCGGQGLRCPQRRPQ